MNTSLGKNHVGNCLRASMERKIQPKSKQVQQGSTGQPCSDFWSSYFTDRETDHRSAQTTCECFNQMEDSSVVKETEKARLTQETQGNLQGRSSGFDPDKKMWAAKAKEDRLQGGDWGEHDSVSVFNLVFLSPVFILFKLEL